MDLQMMGIESPLVSTLQHMLDIPEEVEKAFNTTTRTYVRNTKAMASTSAGVYISDVLGLKHLITDPGEQLGAVACLLDSGVGVDREARDGVLVEDNVLEISCERKRKDEGAKYLRMERRVGKTMRKFAQPEDAITDAISVPISVVQKPFVSG